MSSRDVQRAARLWGDADRSAFYAAGGLMWDQVAAVRRRINARITGDPERDWIAHLKATHLAGRVPVPQCLSLCCGEGRIERALAAQGMFEQCVAYDVSPGALERARALAAEAGFTHIRYELCNINEAELPEAAFDLIIAHGALHHLAALEHVCEQLNRALRPGGLVVALEYVGPDRCAVSARRAEVCTAALRLLPERFRRSVSWQRTGRIGPGAERSALDWLRLGWLKARHGALAAAVRRRRSQTQLRRQDGVCLRDEVTQARAAEMALDDPTEAVRSSEIPSVLAATFEVLETKPYGAGLLRLVLDDIAGNFEEGDPVAEDLLQMLFAIEDRLEATGELESDFVFIVARRRG